MDVGPSASVPGPQGPDHKLHRFRSGNARKLRRRLFGQDTVNGELHWALLGNVQCTVQVPAIGVVSGELRGGSAHARRGFGPGGRCAAWDIEHCSLRREIARLPQATPLC